MPKRTAAELVREATDDPYELQVGSGKSARFIQPRPMSDMTRAEQMEHGRILDAWSAVAGSVPMKWPETPSGAREMEPDEFVFRFRFNALKAREVTDDDPRQFVAADKSADYDAFRRDYVDKLPWRALGDEMRAIDRHYDPEPASDAERAAAQAADLLQQCRELVESGGLNTDMTTNLLARIDSSLEKAGAAAGKSASAAT